ncbi:unnamed protein product [Polarella glacialis]|uniref:Bestrophin homolog n=1 Tax=Polarella glacialis TaxID=89957 RepID=A0A813HHF9_POLGL|nr:unnamed protein product [Polarella glacialis]
MQRIHRGQVLGTFAPELSAQMYSQAVSLHGRILSCIMVIEQNSPGPFVVHMRTFLMMFCFTFPFTAIAAFQPLMILPMQMMLSFALLGIEFFSREMEHPFGDDAVDIPVSAVMDNVKRMVQEVQDYERLRFKRAD